MNSLGVFGAALLLALVSLALGQSKVELFRLSDTSTSTYTPEIVTIPDSNGTSTSVYRSTEFPLWSTTESTPNVTTSNGTETTPTMTPTMTTSTSTGTPTANPTSSSPNPNVTTTEPPTPTTVTPTVPVPTMPPEPVAPLEPWNLTYSGNSSNYCIMLSFAARIDVSYNNVLNQTVTTGLDIGDNSTVDPKTSKCSPGSSQQVFALRFDVSGSASKGLLEITFQQDQSNNDSTIYGVQFTVSITEDLFPGISSTYLGKTVTLSTSNLTLFDTQPEHSFSCVSLIKTNLNTVQVHDQLNNKAFGETFLIESGILETSNLKVQAFMPNDQKVETFFPESACPQDKTDISSAIPITVGLILLFMVVVVLIAYFIGRSRQQKNTAV